MPLTIRTQPCLPCPETSQSQAASEQTALAWAQGGWQQQQLDDGPCWIRVDDINANGATESGPNETPSYRLDEMSPSVAWSVRRAQQDTDNTAYVQTNGSMAEWPASDYWQTAMYDIPNTSAYSPTFSDGAGQKSATLPLFLRSSDIQVPEPPSASSSSSNFSPDLQAPPFQLNAGVDSTSRRTSLKRSPSSGLNVLSVEVEELAKPKPKRGRPRLPRNEPHVCNDFPCTHVIEGSGSRRVPHNQVERKYRNGLNAELERLRETVAMASSHAFAHLSNTSAKPSKAMVLASAIDYIKSIEEERNSLAEKIQVLRAKNKRLRREKIATGNESS